MDTRIGTTMSQKDKDQRSQMLAEITDYMLNTQTRGEQAEERILKAEIERLDKEHMRILETEWADHKDLWEWMLHKGNTPRETLDFLRSFA